MVKLERLDLVNCFAEEQVDEEQHEEQQFNDESISQLGDGIKELTLCNLDSVSPMAIGLKLSNLKDLTISGCGLFENCGEVCRLCRALEELVIREVEVEEGGEGFGDGFFRASFFGLGEKEDEKEEEEEEEEEEEKEEEEKSQKSQRPSLN